MIKANMKDELVQTVQTAVAEYLRSTRGANAFGASADVTHPKRNVLLVSSKTPEHGLAFFEVLIKESYS